MNRSTATEQETTLRLVAKWRNGSDRGTIYGELLFNTFDVLPSEAALREGQG